MLVTQRDKSVENSRILHHLGGSFTPAQIESNYNSIISKGDKSPNYENFIETVERSFAILYSDYNSKPADAKDAKKIIKFLKDKNFNFELVRNRVLIDKLKVSDSLIFVHDKNDKEKLSSEKSANNSKIKELKEDYYELSNINNAINMVSAETENLFKMAEEIFNLKIEMNNPTLKRITLFSSIIKKSQQKLLAMKEEKLQKTLIKSGLSKEQIKEMFISKRNSFIIEKAIEHNEQGKQYMFTEIQEKAIAESFNRNYGPLLEIAKNIEVENSL